MTLGLILLGFVLIGCSVVPFGLGWLQRRRLRAERGRSSRRAVTSANPLWSRKADSATPAGSLEAGWPEQIMESTHDAIIIWEMDGRGILYWNRSAEMLYGYTREQAHGRVTHELLKTQLAGGVDELETRLARFGVWVGDLCHTCADGHRVEVSGRLSILARGHGPCLILEINRDVTDRKRAEVERRQMEAQLRRLRSTFID